MPLLKNIAVWIAFAVMLIFSQCKQKKVIASEPGWLGDTSVVITKNNGQCKIFYADYKFDLFPYGPAPRWSPTRKDVILADSILVNFISTSNIPTERIKLNIASYYRQYLGIIDKDGKKFIYVNCLYPYPQFSDSWYKYMITVDDGGDSFFYVNIDLEKKQVLKMKIN